jgi:hypothetical protein
MLWKPTDLPEKVLSDFFTVFSMCLLEFAKRFNFNWQAVEIVQYFNFVRFWNSYCLYLPDT